jgi:Ca2+-binding EF-hand superfamily protein
MKTFLILSTIFIFSTNISPSFASGCGGNNHAHTNEEMALKYFDQIDTNSDGTVDLMEFKKSQMSNLLESFDLLSPDKNGLVSKKSFIKNFVQLHSTPATEI